MKSILGKVLLVLLSIFMLVSVASAQKANVKILATGGTIAGAAKSSSDAIGYKSAVTAVEQLIAAVPELDKVANVTGEQIAQIGSQDMTDDVWLKLAKRVNTLLAQKDVDGVVITHGTDTMEETAFFLNLVVKSDKPVVLVGAMRPGTAMSADGPMNIYNAVVVAASKISKGKGVLVMMNDTIHSARNVTKTNTILPSAFANHDFGALGYVLSGVPKFYNTSVQKHTTASEFDVMSLETLPRVDIVYSYAGTHSEVAVDAFVGAGAKGIIHAGTGNGSVHKNTLPSLDKARKGGVIVVRSSRVGGGIVARNGELSDDEHDFVVSDTLNPQKAKVLLQLIMAKYPTADRKKIQELFYTY